MENPDVASTRPEEPVNAEELVAEVEQSKAIRIDAVAEYLASFDKLETEFHGGEKDKEALGALEETRDAEGAKVDEFEDLSRDGAARKLLSFQEYLEAETKLNEASKAKAPEAEVGRLEEERDAKRHAFGEGLDEIMRAENPEERYRKIAEAYIAEQEAKAEFLQENPELTGEIGGATVTAAEEAPEGGAGAAPEAAPEAEAQPELSAEEKLRRLKDEFAQAVEDGIDMGEFERRRAEIEALEREVAAAGADGEQPEAEAASEETSEGAPEVAAEGETEQPEQPAEAGGETDDDDEDDGFDDAFETSGGSRTRSVVTPAPAPVPAPGEGGEAENPEGQTPEAQQNPGGQQNPEGQGAEVQEEPETQGSESQEPGAPEPEPQGQEPEHQPEVVEGTGQPEQQESTPERPLVAVNLDLEKDARNAAHDIAEKWFAEKRAGRKGFFKKLVLGVTDNMFREAKIKRYEAQAYEAIVAKQEGQANRLTDQDWAANKAGIARFVEAYVSGYEQELIHRAAGEDMEVFGVERDDQGNEVVYKYMRGEDGGQRKEAMGEDTPEAKATKGMHNAISEYAQGRMDRAAFEEQMGRIQAELKDAGSKSDLMINNYLELAEVAKERFDHEGRIENVMEGFRLINGEARRGVRSEAHRDALDRLTNSLSNMPGLRWIPPEVIGGAVGVATYVTKNTARTALRALIPGVGGAVGAGTLAGLKERNRVAGDRQTLARRLATGETSGDTKYDKAMLETMYEMKPASEYTQNLLQKMEALRADATPENLKALIGSLAQVEVAIKRSDQIGGKGIDLISYSSGDTEVIERERLALDVARAQVKTLLSQNGQRNLQEVAAYKNAERDANEAFEADISAKDRAFRSLRRRREAAQFTKTATISMATMVAGQEIVAAFSPDKYGVVDWARGEANTSGQNATILGELMHRVKPNTSLVTTQVAGEAVTTQMYESATLSPDQVEQMKSQGLIVSPREIAGENQVTIESSVQDYAAKYGTRVHRVDWGSNGTVPYDGNELRVYFGNNGTGDTFVSGMRGVSTTWGGETINYADALGQGKIKMLLSLSQDTQGSPIELVGNMNANGQIEFSAPNEEIRQIIADRAYRFAEVVYDKGLNADGVREDIIPLATAVGPGVTSTIRDVVTEATKRTVYDVFEVTTPMIDVTNEVVIPIENIMATAGVAFTRRKELTVGQQPTPGQQSTPRVEAVPNGSEPTRPENPTEPQGPTPPTGGGTVEGPAPVGGEVVEGQEPPEPPAGGGSVVEGEQPPVGGEVVEEEPGEPEGEPGNPETAELQEDIQELLNWPWEEELEDDAERDEHQRGAFNIAARQHWWANQAQSKLDDLRSKDLISQQQYEQMFNDIARSKQMAKDEAIRRYAAAHNMESETPLRIATRAVVGEQGRFLDEPVSVADQIIARNLRAVEQQYASPNYGREETEENEQTAG